MLGDEHPDTLSAMLDLADCLWAQGRLIAARRLEEQVVAGRRRRLGEDHFDTLKASGKLADQWPRRVSWLPRGLCKRRW